MSDSQNSDPRTTPEVSWWKGTEYEVLDDMTDEQGEVTLSASYTPNNGIRVQLLDSDSDDPDWRVFDFTTEQAEIIGRALVRWAEAHRASPYSVRKPNTMTDRDPVSQTTAQSEYTLGWNDGYSEGYACKLADVTEPFMPTGGVAEIETVADMLQVRLAVIFANDRSGAIGLARSIVMAARSALK